MKRSHRFQNGWRWARHGWAMAGAALAMHWTAAAAWAQKPGRLPGEDKGMVQWAIAIGIAILICIPAFLNPKRSHRR